MKKVVIFGGSGFLGSYVADELSRRGYDVIIADISPSPYLQPSQTFLKVNIMESLEIEKAIVGADIIYNFVAIANIDEAIHKPVQTMTINVMGHLNILEACRQNGKIDRFIYASSAYALSSDGSFYGISKHSSEKLTEEYYKRYGLKYTVIRYGSLYGERASHNNYIYNLLKEALTTKQLHYKGDGQDLREYIHAADAAKLSVNIIEDAQYENEHIILTGIEKLKRIELLTMINEIMRNELTINQLSTGNMGHYRITPYTFHPTAAKKLVANPYIDLGQGLLECIQTIHCEFQNK
ncbi:MAG: UDP-glucose 4-epimerase [Sulfuricurvum sp. PD_MW2]|jgi:UDP-glucose 4-epimerase|uniref:NAD-dependent epimerase/dehydratase family protein n=1 Tax=Sulfuricurvum sp. PD_MW2 TaxID=2027917 RepID=UPI000C066F3A|nr:NAD(P)-dependent oxidoreductase [Sulfuricurvum sp. PD_MW2]PHM16486.1 MAG: UDP-glucose 4-epimerase [Sulfuricurvum sp. PD_MW2]